MSLSERGFLSWITGSGVLVQEQLERDTAAIEAYYANRGFIDVTVGQPIVDFKEDGIYITFQVSEGQRYRVNEVDITGDILVEKERLLELIEMDELAEDDEFLDRSVMRDDAQALAEYYADYGFAFAETDYEIDVNKEEFNVDITYRMHKHQKVYIRRVLVTGNTETRENVIRREMRLSDGDRFSGSMLRRSNERLRKLDYFEEVEVEPVRTMNEDELDLRVKVKEKPTGELSAGVGYSSFARFYVQGGVQERNLFGKGYALSLSGTFSGRSLGFNLGFTNPHVYDTPLAVGGDLYYNSAEFDEFEKDTLGGRVRFGYPLGEYSRLNWSYRLDRYTISEVSNNAADEIKDVEGVNWSSAAAIGAVRDTTDRRLNPTSGSVNQISIEYAGGLLLGDDEFVKYIVDTSQYYLLPWGNEHVFHFHAQAGLVTENFGGDEIPVFERFYLGGMNSIRGYTGGRISPYDEETGDRIGGTKQAFANFEYIFPLLSDFGLVGVTFFDMGDAWEDEFDLKRSVGAGIRWYSPMGPMRLEYGYALDEVRDQGNRGKLEFSVGQFF
jgi:outer membrane protein insertion porin family